MYINELFYSLQGEGRLTGVPSVFVRISGCPLRCRWCDTKYAWDEESGRDMAVEEIAMEAARYPSKFIVITGGEPMVNPHLPLLTAALARAGRHITLETAGLAFTADLPVDLMSISPKLSNSRPDDERLAKVHESTRLNIKAIRQLIKHYDYQLKFVIDSEDDLIEAQGLIEEIGNVNAAKVMLMPQASDKETLLGKSPMVADMCSRTGFTFCQRLHILLWGNTRGK
jgi:7-carboxy-7-deazaguanine synthase